MKYLILLFFCSTIAAAPLVENREPRPDEIGYLPVPVATFNPPSFAWLHERPAVSYTLQWCQDAGFQSAVTTITNLQFNCYTHNEPFAIGDYFWRYRYVTAKGEQSEWSLVRTVSVNDAAIVFPMPSREDRHKLVPAQHPRLFLRPEHLPKLREAAKGSAKSRFDPLISSADRLLTRPPTPEPTARGSANDKKDAEAIKYWWPNRERAVQASTEAETLAFVYLITQEKKYGEAARERIVALAKWDPDGPTNFRLNCEAGKPLLHRISRAYDWAYDALTEEDRALVQKAVARRIKDAWESGEVGYGVGHLNRPQGSHSNRTWHKIGESGIVFLGEIPEAEMWLDYALNKYFACYPVWSDDDGGWHEGMAYLGGYMSKAVWWLHAAQHALNLDPLKKPFFSQVGDFALYLTPPHSPNMGFGDSSYQPHTGGWGAFMEYFQRVGADNPNSNTAQWRWWGEQWKTSQAGGILGFLYAATLPQVPDSQPPINLPHSKVFRGIGVASLHTTLLNSSNDVHFLFKSSPFGRQSHGHNAQNTFQLNAYGDSLLLSCNYRDLHGSDFHRNWAHQTISQNTVLVNSKGQRSVGPFAQGKIDDFKLTPEWDYVLGNAVDAYEGRLKKANRHILFLKPDIIVIYDDLEAPEEADFQFMLHSLSEFELPSSSTAELHIQRPGAGALIQYHGSLPVKFRQWDGFDPQPERRQFPNNWHLETSTATKAKEVQMFTVIAPHRGKDRPELKVERIQSASANGLKLKINGRSTVVGFRKGVTGKAELSGVTFESPVLVQVAQDSATK